MFDIEKARAKGMPEGSIRIMEQVNENRRKRESCKGHDFDVPGYHLKYRCKNCGCEEPVEYLTGYKDACRHKDEEIDALRSDRDAWRKRAEAAEADMSVMADISQYAVCDLCKWYGEDGCTHPDPDAQDNCFEWNYPRDDGKEGSK